MMQILRSLRKPKKQPSRFSYEAFFLVPAVERLAVSITLQNFKMTFSHFPSTAGMTAILTDHQSSFPGSVSSSFPWLLIIFISTEHES